MFWSLIYEKGQDEIHLHTFIKKALNWKCIGSLEIFFDLNPEEKCNNVNNKKKTYSEAGEETNFK